MMSSGAWLVLSGVVLGSAIHHTQLDALIAQYIQPICGRSYHHALWGTILLCTIFMFIMPSAMGRVILIIPILEALCQKLGYQKDDKEREGILILGILTTYFPAFYILPANVPNTVLISAMQSFYGLNFYYGSYFLAYFPILGLSKMLILYFLTVFFFSGKKKPQPLPKGKISISPLHKKAILLFSLTILLWFTENFHHIASGWVGLLAATICLFPNSGLLPKNPLSKVNFGPFFYVAGAVGMGMVAKYSHLTNYMAQFFLNLLPFSEMSKLEVVFFWLLLCIITGLLIMQTAIPAVLTPLIDNFSAVTGLSANFLCKMEVFGFSSIALPYQAPALIVGMNMAHLSKAKMTIFCFVCSIGSILILTKPLLWWWQIIGIN